ncbi:MAG: hypothetical protein J7599_19060 [Niabella sp.]|nr:hypothetical protein [Niabella sp.]
MKKLKLKDVIEFNRMTDARKKNFVANLKGEEKAEKIDDSGGDYWVSSISALKAYFRFGDKDAYDEKIIKLEEKAESTRVDHVRDQFQRNINIMRSYENVDFSKWKPAGGSTVIKNQTHTYITVLNGFEIKAAQWFAFEFKESEVDKIGGIWYVAQKGGYSKVELSMFAEILYRYLNKNYKKKHEVDAKFCIVVDVISGEELTYEQIITGEVSPLLISTLNNIRRMM